MKAKTDDWVRVANAALEARDELRGALPLFNDLQRAIGNNLDNLSALDRLRAAVLKAVNGLRLALKGRPA